jgi:hypothetical protein
VPNCSRWRHGLPNRNPGADILQSPRALSHIYTAQHRAAPPSFGAKQAVCFQCFPVGQTGRNPPRAALRQWPRAPAAPHAARTVQHAHRICARASLREQPHPRQSTTDLEKPSGGYCLCQLHRIQHTEREWQRGRERDPARCLRLGRECHDGIDLHFCRGGWERIQSVRSSMPHGIPGDRGGQAEREAGANAMMAQ